MNTSFLHSATHSRKLSMTMQVWLKHLRHVCVPWYDSEFLSIDWYQLAFYFNFKGSILGELIPCPISNEIPIPHAHFLATPLLPCGVVDGAVRKFTGNGQIGDADDDITKAVHAFAHFSLLYSQNNVLFCDLQGTYYIYNSYSSFKLTFFSSTRQVR